MGFKGIGTARCVCVCARALISKGGSFLRAAFLC